MDGSVKVEVNSTVDFNTPGEYTVTYTATDKAGNTTTLTRKVVVKKNVKEVNIPDARLKAALNKAIDSKRTENQAISSKELERLKGTLEFSKLGISNLEGLQYATNITGLKLNENADITDLQPLTKLTNLTLLWLDRDSKISDITPLQSLTHLTNLGLSNLPKLADIHPLQNLVQLTHVTLDHDSIADLRPLKGLSNLWKLTVYQQQIEGKEVVSNGGQAVVPNTLVDPEGQPVAITSGEGYTYDEAQHQVIFSGIDKTSDKTYYFSQQEIKVGHVTTWYNGKVTQKVIVKDITGPVIKVDGVENPEKTPIEVTEGETYDLAKGVTAIDEVDGSVKVEVNSTVDFNTSGEYTVTDKIDEQPIPIVNREAYMYDVQKNQVLFTGIASDTKKTMYSKKEKQLVNFKMFFLVVGSRVTQKIIYKK